jgi:hypothetical protein
MLVYLHYNFKVSKDLTLELSNLIIPEVDQKNPEKETIIKKIETTIISKEMIIIKIEKTMMNIM